MADIFQARWGKKVARQLERVPPQISRKFYVWVGAIELVGILDVTAIASQYEGSPVAGITRRALGRIPKRAAISKA